MNFFDFNQTEILPYSKTNASKRDARIAENLKNLKESMTNEKAMNMYQEQVQSELLREENAKNLVNNRTIMGRRRRQEDIRLEKVLITKTLSKYLSEMVISGLVFDEDFIEKQSGLTNKISTYVENMFSDNVISDSNFTDNGNLMMEAAYYEIVDIVKDKIRNRDTVDIFSESIVDEILSEARKSKDLSDEIANEVKDKVKDTIKEEKKISKKKEEEKEDEEEMNKEVSDAADSLDNDVESDSGEDEEDDISDDELDAMEKETDDEELDDSDEGLDDLGEDEPEDLESDGITKEGEATDGEPSEEEHADDAEALDQAADEAEATDSTEEPELDAEAEGKSDNTMKITIETDGKNVSVNANKSESTEFLNIFGKSRYEERNSKTLFRNLLEGNIEYASSILKESNETSGIKMDLVLAETITEYTLLETMFTSRIFNLSPSEMKSLMKTVNFNRK